MSEALSIVLGNPFVTFQSVHYEAKSGCEIGPDTSEEGDPQACLDDTPSVQRCASDIVYVNRQVTAITAGVVKAEETMRERVSALFPGSRYVRSIVSDPFALPDLIKTGDFHERFNRRFFRATGKKLDETGSLLEDLKKQIRFVLDQVHLFVQMDQPGDVRDFLTEEAFSDLLREFGLNSHTQFKAALTGDAMLSRGFRLDELHPVIGVPFQDPLEASSFELKNVSVIFERVLRDYIRALAFSLDWDDDVNFSATTGQLFYPPTIDGLERRAVNFVPGKRKSDKAGDLKPVVACLGVVGGLPALISHQQPGSQCMLYMEQDSNHKRVDPDIIAAGIRFYLEKISNEPVVPAFSGQEERPMPEPVIPALYMTELQVKAFDTNPGL